MTLFLCAHILVGKKEIRQRGLNMENCRMNCSCGAGNPAAGRRDDGAWMPKNHPMDCIREKFPLGMGYVPVQKFGQTYDLCTGFQRGTLFPELFLPFCGKGGAGC